MVLVRGALNGPDSRGDRSPSLSSINLGMAELGSTINEKTIQTERLSGVTLVFVQMVHQQLSPLYWLIGGSVLGKRGC